MTPAITILLLIIIDLCIIIITTIMTHTIMLKVNSPCDPRHGRFHISIIENNSSVFPTKLKRHL